MRHVYERPEDLPPCCVAVGRFEGVHRGHLAAAGRLAAEGRARGLTTVLVSLYDPDRPTLTTEAEKARLFAGCGVDWMVSLERSAPLLAMSPAAFTRLVLKEGLHACCAVTGQAHKDAFPGLETVALPMLTGADAALDAQLEAAFAAHQMEEYAALCGHPYSMHGIIVHGQKLGRTVGMPTANLELPQNKRRPPEGVYATRSIIGGEIRLGLTNVGRRPTVDRSGAMTVETYLLDLDRDLYGEEQQLEICCHIRDVVKFDSLDQVKAQVDQDILRVRERLAHGIHGRG